MNDRGFRADVLHDVDFSAIGPSGGGEIVAEQPEGRPNPLTVWKLDARFEPAVFLGEFSLRLNAPRGVAALNPVGANEFFTNRLEDKLAVFHADVSVARSVILQLPIAPAASAILNLPLGCIRRRAISAIELVAPGENPVGFGRGRR